MSTPALGPGHSDTGEDLPPLDQSGDLGQVVVIIGCVALLLASWGLFGLDARAMWAGYTSSGLAIVAIIANASLKSTLPRAPGIGVTVLAGLGLIVLGLFQIGHTKTIPIFQITCGAMMVIGGALQA